MKTISLLLAVAALMFVDLALAASAVITSVTGTAQAQTGTASPRPLRLGDEVKQGDTVSTGPSSSVVIKFDDGQVAALTANSRMVINAYEYDAKTRSGNVLLSLAAGGMRAITGLIGRLSPSRVAYRAGTATIGIRGTDVDVLLGDNIVVVKVNDGTITFTFAGQTVTVPAGQGAIGANGQITPGAAQFIFNQLPPALQEALGGLDGLTDAINRALAGVPRDEGQGTSGTTTTPSGGTTPGSTGGGNASAR